MRLNKQQSVSYRLINPTDPDSSCSASQIISRPIEKPKIHYHVHKAVIRFLVSAEASLHLSVFSPLGLFLILPCHYTYPINVIVHFPCLPFMHHVHPSSTSFFSARWNVGRHRAHLTHTVFRPSAVSSFMLLCHVDPRPVYSSHAAVFHVFYHLVLL